MLDFDHGVRNEPDEAGIVADLRGGDPERTVTWRPGGRTVTGRLSSSLANVRSRDTRIPRAGGRCPRACRGGAAVTTRQPFVRHQTNGPQAGRRRKASPPPAALPYLPGGATPRNPPVAQGPVPSSRGLGRICPGERPPGTPRWPTARFLRYRAGAVFTRGSDPRNPPVAQGPVPSSRGLGRVYPGERPPGNLPVARVYPGGATPRTPMAYGPAGPRSAPLEPRMAEGPVVRHGAFGRCWDQE